jgi:hypothetical protein
MRLSDSRTTSETLPSATAIKTEDAVLSHHWGKGLCRPVTEFLQLESYVTQHRPNFAEISGICRCLTQILR